jgi:hypothetical protein
MIGSSSSFNIEPLSQLKTGEGNRWDESKRIRLFGEERKPAKSFIARMQLIAACAVIQL